MKQQAQIRMESNIKQKSQKINKKHNVEFLRARKLYVLKMSQCVCV